MYVGWGRGQAVIGLQKTVELARRENALCPGTMATPLVHHPPEARAIGQDYKGIESRVPVGASHHCLLTAFTFEK